MSPWRAEFPTVGAMPARFGPPDEFDAQALAMTNDLAVRREGGGTYYRFTRTYAPRAWADYDYLWRRSIPPDIRRQLESGVDVDDMPEEERNALIEGSIAFERRKLELWADRALAAVAPGRARLVHVQFAIRVGISNWQAQGADQRIGDRDAGQ